MTTRLAAQKIEIKYDARLAPVLSDLTLEIRAGEFLGIVGPNGSGKSTLVRALSRALRPTQGLVMLDGHDLFRQTSARDSARAIGVVPQSAAVSLGFTVREIVRMGRAPHLPRRPFAAESGRDEEVVTGAMRTAGVEGLAERVATTLSGGEWQRVLLARALAQETDVLLLDEPTAHLDIRHQWDALHLARSLAHENSKAVLAVLHDLNLAAAYCDRLLLLSDGRIVAQGTPAEVLTPENVHRVYGARVWVRCHPTSGRPVILSLPDAPGADALPDADGPKVHVICGGGTGAPLLLALRRQGYFVSAGALNDGDTDAEAAEMLAVPFVREAPFSALSAESLAEAQRLAEEADIVIVSDAPWGRANVAALALALNARRADHPVLCLSPPEVSFAARDFTNGEAVRLWDQLLSAGAISVPDVDTALASLLKYVTPDVRKEND